MSVDGQGTARAAGGMRVPRPLPPAGYLARPAHIDNAAASQPPRPLTPARYAMAPTIAPEATSSQPAKSAAVPQAVTVPSVQKRLHPLAGRAKGYHRSQKPAPPPSEPTRKPTPSSSTTPTPLLELSPRVSAPVTQHTEPALPPPAPMPASQFGAFRPADPHLSSGRGRVGVADTIPSQPLPPPDRPALVRAPPAPPIGLKSTTTTKPATRFRDRGWWAAVLYWSGAAVCAYLALIGLLILLYRFIDPPFSTLMVQRWFGGTEIHQTFVPLEKVSPNLIRAVVVSEDGRFCQHYGVDIQEIRAAIKRGGDGTPRGASTISMQVVKNLFLWPAKSYIRKAIELPVTYAMELIWPKWRVLEIYLNIAEWGPGIFGIEEASRYHFKKSAASLSQREAARLAVSLPNPFRRIAGKPGPGTRRLATVIQRRMRQVGRSSLACVLPDQK